MSTFYANFVNMCASHGISPSGAAAAIGLSNAAATGWKKGKVPSDTTLAKLSKLFGCTVEDLTGETKKPTGTAADELDNELINLLSSLTPGQIANVTAYIQGMLSK